MHEQSKAAKRRFYDGAFLSRYFVGHGIDIGGRPDPLQQYVGIFPLMRSVRTWDREDGDAQFMTGVTDESFDFVHSSHCLEHMVDVYEALRNWSRVLKLGGYLIVTVPEEDLYELQSWPSQFNPEHQWTFTIAKASSWSPKSINIVDLVKHFAATLEAERIVCQQDFFQEQLREQKVDQSLSLVAECSIEIVWRKCPE